MSQPYNDWNAGQYDRDGFDHRHFANSYREPTRLPPPESLAAGVPVGLGTTQSNEYFHPRNEQPYENSNASNMNYPGAPPYGGYHESATGPAHAPAYPYQGPSGSGTSETLNPSTRYHPGDVNVPWEQYMASQQQIPSNQNPYQAGQVQPQYPPDAQQSTWSQQRSSSSAPSPSIQRHPMKMASSKGIFNLLGDDRQDAASQVDFSLVIRQQPKAARSCGFGERDRRQIDPPPIVELVVRGPDLSSEDKKNYLRFPHYVMECTILDETGTIDAHYIEEYRHHRRLVGSPSVSPFFGKDEHGQEGCFFCFHDLSCRTAGLYRLKFSLVMLSLPPAKTGSHFPVICEATTEVFQAYNAKDFPGMRPSSTLAKRLKQQGCMIAIKKGTDKSHQNKEVDEASDEDHD